MKRTIPVPHLKIALTLDAPPPNSRLNFAIRVDTIPFTRAVLASYDSYVKGRHSGVAMFSYEKGNACCVAPNEVWFLFGPKERPGNGVRLELERRSHERFKVDVSSVCSAKAREPIAASITDVSLSGCSLIAERSFEVGEAISLDLEKDWQRANVVPLWFPNRRRIDGRVVRRLDDGSARQRPDENAFDVQWKVQEKTPFHRVACVFSSATSLR